MLHRDVPITDEEWVSIKEDIETASAVGVSEKDSNADGGGRCSNRKKARETKKVEKKKVMQEARKKRKAAKKGGSVNKELPSLVIQEPSGAVASTSELAQKVSRFSTSKLLLSRMMKMIDRIRSTWSPSESCAGCGVG